MSNIPLTVAIKLPHGVGKCAVVAATPRMTEAIRAFVCANFPGKMVRHPVPEIQFPVTNWDIGHESNVSATISGVPGGISDPHKLNELVADLLSEMYPSNYIVVTNHIFQVGRAERRPHASIEQHHV